MNKTNPCWWIGHYFGQNCIIHPNTGRWLLVGYMEGEVYCRKNIGAEDEDCMSYPISEIQFILKRINPFLFASMSKFHWFLKTKAGEGYWMFPRENFNQIIYEG
jgi:hypothetical protein